MRTTNGYINIYDDHYSPGTLKYGYEVHTTLGNAIGAAKRAMSTHVATHELGFDEQGKPWIVSTTVTL